MMKGFIEVKANDKYPQFVIVNARKITRVVKNCIYFSEDNYLISQEPCDVLKQKIEEAINEMTCKDCNHNNENNIGVLKGFIEVTGSKFDEETLYQVNVKHIDCFVDKSIAVTGGFILPVKETYEEIKQKIKEAVE